MNVHLHVYLYAHVHVHVYNVQLQHVHVSIKEVAAENDAAYNSDCWRGLCVGVSYRYVSSS